MVRITILITNDNFLFDYFVVDHPVYFLYTLLHYYSNSLVDHPQLKHHIVSTILGKL